MISIIAISIFFNQICGRKIDKNGVENISQT